MTAIVSKELSALLATFAHAVGALGKRGAAVAQARALVADALTNLVKVDGTPEAMIIFRETHRVNYISGYTGEGVMKIKAWLNDKDATKHKPKDGSAASVYQLAYAAEAVEYTRVKSAAGLTLDNRGAATPAARAKAAEAKEKRDALKAAANIASGSEIVNAPVASSDSFTAPRSLDDVVAQLDDVRREVSRLQKAASAAKLLDGDNGATVRDAIATILKAAKSIHAAPRNVAERRAA